MSNPLIELKDFTITVKDPYKKIIDSLNLKIFPGEIFGIIGPSGAGKTTLLKSIALLLDARVIGGIYNYEQKQVFPVNKNNNIEEIRRNIVFIHQEPVLFRGTVKYNIQYGLRVRGIKDYKEILEPLIDSFNIKHLLKRDVSSLSSGEKQRVCLLRAMALKPRVLILDEPTHNLDPSNVANIEANIKQYLEDDGGTIIIVTHNIFQAKRITDRIAILINGQVIEVNETKKLFESPKEQITADFLSGKMIF